MQCFAYYADNIHFAGRLFVYILCTFLFKNFHKLIKNIINFYKEKVENIKEFKLIETF